MSAYTLNRTLTCYLKVKDFHKAVAWYRDVMGFSVDYQVEEMRWAELSTGIEGVTVGLGEEPEAAGREGGAILVFGTTDIDAHRAALEARDVRFQGETQTIPGMVKLATFFDPDGNKLMLSQSLAG